LVLVSSSAHLTLVGESGNKKKVAAVSQPMLQVQGLITYWKR
jgi:hypothetical protein